MRAISRSAMIYFDRNLFIHTPKVGGMSATNWLLNNVDGEICLFIPGSGVDHLSKLDLYPDVAARLVFYPGNRHETVDEGLKLLAENDLLKPKRIFSFIRPPHKMMASYYFHLLKPAVRGRGRSRNANLLAKCLTIEEFSMLAAFFNRRTEDIGNFFECADPEIQMDTVPLQFMRDYLYRTFADFKNFGRLSLEKRNTSDNSIYTANNDINVAIDNRFRNLIRIYEQALSSYSAGHKTPFDYRIFAKDKLVQISKNLEGQMSHRKGMSRSDFVDVTVNRQNKSQLLLYIDKLEKDLGELPVKKAKQPQAIDAFKIVNRSALNVESGSKKKQSHFNLVEILNLKDAANNCLIIGGVPDLLEHYLMRSGIAKTCHSISETPDSVYRANIITELNNAAVNYEFTPLDRVNCAENAYDFVFVRADISKIADPDRLIEQVYQAVKTTGQVVVMNVPLPITKKGRSDSTSVLDDLLLALPLEYQSPELLKVVSESKGMDVEVNASQRIALLGKITNRFEVIETGLNGAIGRNIVRLGNVEKFGTKTKFREMYRVLTWVDKMFLDQDIYPAETYHLVLKARSKPQAPSTITS